MPSIIPPPPLGQDMGEVSWAQFFEIVRKQLNEPAYFSSPVDPGPAGVPSGTWGVWLNTTSGVLKLWANQGGVMKSTTLT